MLKQNADWDENARMAKKGSGTIVRRDMAVEGKDDR